MFGHSGINHLNGTFGMSFFVTVLEKSYEEYWCTQCQLNKQWSRVWITNPRHAPLSPWDDVAVDLVGTWKIKSREEEIEFNVLACIDLVTNIMELMQDSNTRCRAV